MILDTATRKLQVVLSEAKTTNDCPVVASYFDSAATPSGGPSLSNTNGTTAVDIVAAPAASAIRQVNELTVFNADTVSHGVTVRYNDNSTLYSIIKATLAPGYTLTYSKSLGWAVMSPTGLFIAGQIPGTATNDNAAAGMVGEVALADLPSGSSVAVSGSLIATDIASKSLTPGDWNVWGSIGYSPGASSTVFIVRGWVNDVSATQPTSFSQGLVSLDYGSGGIVASSASVIAIPQKRFSLSVTTTIYLTARFSYSGSASTGFGSLYARRVR